MRNTDLDQTCEVIDHQMLGTVAFTAETNNDLSGTLLLASPANEISQVRINDGTLPAPQPDKLSVKVREVVEEGHQDRMNTWFARYPHVENIWK